MYKLEMRNGYFLQQLSGPVTVEEVSKFIDEAVKVVRKPGNKLRVLNDYRGSFLSDPKVQEIMKKWVDGNAPYIEKAAVLGIQGIKKMFFNFITLGRKNIKLFDDEESAVKWLLEND